jgi:hypothetical protein
MHQRPSESWGRDRANGFCLFSTLEVVMRRTISDYFGLHFLSAVPGRHDLLLGLGAFRCAGQDSNLSERSDVS